MSDTASTGSITRVKPKPRIQPIWILAGVALAVAAGLAALYVVNQIQTQNQVVQVRANVPRGAEITLADLGEVTVGAVPGVSTVPAAQLQSLVGQRASVDLVDGMLLPAGAVSDTMVPPTGRTLVGLRLEQGRIVAGPLRPASRLRLVVTNPAGAEPGFSDAASLREFRATLVATEPALDGAATLVNVEVAAAEAAQVARLAADNRIAVVQDPQA